VSTSRLLSDGDLNIHTGLNGEAGDLLDDISRRIQVQDSLVDSHLPSVPSVGTLTARRLADHELQLLGRHADGTADLQVLAESLGLQVVAHLLDGGDLGGGQGDSDSVDLDILRVSGGGFHGGSRHFK
jgi:hypothetical protein